MKGKILNSLVKPIDWFIYDVLSEKNKRALVNIIPEGLKKQLKKLTVHGKRSYQKKQVRMMKYHLYDFGLTKTLERMIRKYESLTDSYYKKLIAFEIALWYLNEASAKQAGKSLEYLDYIISIEKNSDELRKVIILKAEALVKLKRNIDAQVILEEYIKDKGIHPDIYFALTNTEHKINKRLDWINKVYELNNLKGIIFDNLDSNPTYDDLRMLESSDKNQESSLVTVIFPVYNAGEGLRTAVRSIQAQTWSNIELIIVDDCSTDNTKKIAEDLEKADSRIRVFSTRENSGPYVARNIGLQHAKGDFITVNDADDWSHESKIEIQVRHLINNPKVIANTSQHIRLTEQLTVYRRGMPGKYMFPNMSSLMFRKKPVLKELGHWDSVRFAGDGEFKRRMLKVFGEEAYVDLETAPLSLPRQNETSLTASSAFGYNGFFMGARREYVESFTFYYENKDSKDYHYGQGERPFPVPAPMLPMKQKRSVMDVIVFSDFREDKEAEALLEEFIKEKKIVGLVQVLSYDLNQSLMIDPSIRKLIDQKTVNMLVYGEEVESKEVLILNSALFNERHRYLPKIRTNTVHVLDEEIDEKSEGNLTDIFNQPMCRYKRNHTDAREWMKRYERI